MLMNFDSFGPVCQGWLVPDNPSAPSRMVAILDGGRRRRIVDALHVRPDVAGAGLHGSGICGFVLDGDFDPAIGRGEPFELYELVSNTLVYRRAAGADLEARIFHLETQSAPVYPLARHLSARIQMVYSGIELMSHETLSSIVRVPWPSVLLAGGALYRNYELAFRHLGYRRLILLSPPARELACRLLRLKGLSADPAYRDGWRGLGQRSLIDALAEVDIASPVALARVLNRLDDEIFSALANPTTRKLVANLPDLPLDKHHVGGALASLASFDVVGFDDDLDLFVDAVEASLGLDALPRDRIEGPPGLDAVMASIAACKPASELLELDEAVYAMARAAFDKGTPEPEEAAPAV